MHDHRPPDMGSSSKDPLPTSTLQRLAAVSGGSTSGSLLDRTRFPLYGNNPARQRGQNGAGTSTLNNGPEIYRIVLHTTGESLWEDLKSLDADLGPGGVPLWSDDDALKVEAGVLVRFLWPALKHGLRLKFTHPRRLSHHHPFALHLIRMLRGSRTLCLLRLRLRSHTTRPPARRSPSTGIAKSREASNAAVVVQ